MKLILAQIKTLCLILLLVSGFAVTSMAEGYRVMVTSVSEDMADGPDVRLLTAVAQKLAVEIHFHRAPFKRRLVMMEHGNLDLICGLLRRPERQAYIHYILPPYKTRSDTIFFVPLEKAGLITTYEDLKGLRVGVARGARYFHQFDRDPTLIKESALPENNFNKLLLGRLDTVIQDESNGIFRIHHMGVADKIAMSPFRFTKEKKVYFGISRQSWMMNSLDHITAVIENLILSGQTKAIITEYYTSQGLPVPAM